MRGVTLDRETGAGEILGCVDIVKGARRREPLPGRLVDLGDVDHTEKNLQCALTLAYQYAGSPQRRRAVMRAKRLPPPAGDGYHDPLPRLGRSQRLEQGRLYERKVDGQKQDTVIESSLAERGDAGDQCHQRPGTRRLFAYGGKSAHARPNLQYRRADGAEHACAACGEGLALPPHERLVGAEAAALPTRQQQTGNHGATVPSPHGRH
jgi:hypothetical protein